MRSRDDDKVPLSGFLKGMTVDFIVFGRVFARSIIKYLFLIVTAAKRVYLYPLSWWLRLKSGAIRLLMKRGSFFATTPRLGLVTVTSTTFLSMFLTPTLFSLQRGSGSELTNLLRQDDVRASSLSVESTLAARVMVESNEKGARKETINYTVQPGDTLSTIGERFLVNTEVLAYVNNISSSAVLHPGDVLKIPPSKGLEKEGSTLIHVVQEGETVSSIAAKYSVSPQAVVDFNYLEKPYLLHAGEELYIPDATIPKAQPESVNNYASTVTQEKGGGLSLSSIAGAGGTGRFTMPTGGVITQYFSWYHRAIDVADKCGTPIVAADGGRIIFARWWAGGGGNSIWIDHGNGYITKYAHMSRFAKTSGTVKKGEVIGYVGETGRAFGCHVHFIVEKNGRPLNPLSVL